VNAQNGELRTLLTRRKGIVIFKLLEFSLNKEIVWSCHIDEKTSVKESLYDMIIGTYLMKEMGIKIDFQQSEMTWDGIICPL
jgi:hypothetical protein